MTWLKLSDDFGDDCARSNLSDAAFRTHVEALLWTMRRETAGSISQRDVKRFAETSRPLEAIDELIKAGFWQIVDSGHWLIDHHMMHQPEPEVILKRRASAAERQRRARIRKAGLSDGGGNAVTNDVTPRVTRVGSGRVGTGRAAPTEKNTLHECAWCGERLTDDATDGMHPDCAIAYAADSTD